MALGLLCLALTLLGTLKIQTQDSILAVIPSPPLSEVPLQPDFQDDQFQGKWHAIGWAQNSNGNESLRQTLKFSSTYERKDDHSYNVSSTWFRDQRCDYRSDTLVPCDQPGQFTLGNLTSYDGLQNYTMRVVATDYNQFALVFYELMFNNMVYFELMLYGRTLKLSHEVEDHFFDFAKSLGLPDEHIVFTESMEECIDE